MKTLLIGWLLCSAAWSQAQASSPQESAGIHRAAPSFVDAGDYIYISAQGPRSADGAVPATFSAQAQQAFTNLKSVVQSAGLTMDNLVYTTVYLTDMTQYGEMNRIYAGYFAGVPPARAVLGIAGLPGGSIQVVATAVRNVSDKKVVSPPGYKSSEPFSPGILTHDRLFVSAVTGGPVSNDPAAQVDAALDSVKAITEAAGLDLSHMVFVNPYLTSRIPSRVMNQHYAQRFEFGNTPARATIEVSSLPNGAQIEYTGVAVVDLKTRRAVRPKNMPPSPTASPCVFAGDTLYCSAKSGFIPGPNEGVFGSTTGLQLRQTMRNQLDNLEEAEMNFCQVVSTTVYLDNLGDTGEFDEVYGKFFPDALPARTTLQQIAPGDRSPDKELRYPDLEQMSLIAVRKDCHARQ